MVAQARFEHAPRKTFVLFSGGNDSSVLAHWAASHCPGGIDGLVFIDTGTALPGVRDFATQFARGIGHELLVYDAGDAFRRLVLELGGFPGPAGHGRAYQRLKERMIRALVRDHKQSHGDRIMLLTGKRKAESSRRYKTTAGIERIGAQLYVNPLMEWSNEDMRQYRQERAVPQSDVAALIHRSGECNCGAFASPGEREMLESLYPEWFESSIAALEREAAAAGVKACVWGRRPPGDKAVKVGPMCSSCELKADA